MGANSVVLKINAEIVRQTTGSHGFHDIKREANIRKKPCRK
jgi:hypothetical protein